jgi:transposase
LRLKILEALDRGIPRTEALRTFGVSIATIERYVRRRRRGGDLAPKSSPGRTPTIGSTVEERRALYKQLEENEMLPLLSVTASCGRRLGGSECRSRRSLRAIRKLGWSRKKDRWVPPPNETKKQEVLGDGFVQKLQATTRYGGLFKT